MPPKSISPLSTVRLGVSSCLLGEEVRFDGGHKRDPFLVLTLGQLVEWVPVCPEVELGLGTPRETIRLVRDPAGSDDVRLMTGKTGIDLTRRMQQYARQRVRALAKEGLSGFVLKKDSPSCGMTRVKVWREEGPSERNGRGLFAAELIRQFPNLPVEEEGRLHDPGLRENFIDRVCMYRRLRTLFAGRWTVGAVVRFHTAHKLVLMAHAPQAYRELGRLVAEAKGAPRAAFSRQYQDELMAAMAKPTTRARHTNALQHAVGHFKVSLDQMSREELGEVIEDYRRGFIPLVVPLTLIRHHARRLEVSYLLGQQYLDPELKELLLRNHV